MRLEYLIKSMLLATALSLSALSTEAKQIKIYVRSQDNTEIGVYAFNRYEQKNGTNDKWYNYEAYGTGASQWNAKTKEVIGGHTWYVSTYDTSKLKAISSNPTNDGDIMDSFFSIQLRNADSTWTARGLYDPGWGIKNNSEGVDRLPNELFFVVDHNAIHNNSTLKDGENSWLGVREITRAQAEVENDNSKEFHYYLMDKNGDRIATFDPVRNQNQGLHTLSGNSFAATVWADKLFTGDTQTAKFYIKAYYKTVTEDDNHNKTTTYTAVTPETSYEYRPWSDYDMTPNGAAKDSKLRDWSDYGDCVARVSDPNQQHYFTITKKDGSDNTPPSLIPFC